MTFLIFILLIVIAFLIGRAVVNSGLGVRIAYKLIRLFGKNPLGRRGPSRESYWIKRDLPRQPKDRFARLF